MLTRDFKDYLGALRLERLRSLTNAERENVLEWKERQEEYAAETNRPEPAQCTLP
jgi:hypothetical protein